MSTVKMPILLEPKLAVDAAPLQQDGMGRDVEDLALVHDQDQVAFGERGKPV